MITHCYCVYLHILERRGTKSRAADEAKKLRAEEEWFMAESAAGGVKVTSYSAGKKKKSPKSVDAQDKNNEMERCGAEESAMMIKAMESIVGNVNPIESPTKKKHRNIKELNELANQLLNEIAAKKAVGLPIDRSVMQLKCIEEKREELLNLSAGSGRSLQEDFNNSSPDN